MTGASADVASYCPPILIQTFACRCPYGLNGKVECQGSRVNEDTSCSSWARSVVPALSASWRLPTLVEGAVPDLEAPAFRRSARLRQHRAPRRGVALTPKTGLHVIRRWLVRSGSGSGNQAD